MVESIPSVCTLVVPHPHPPPPPRPPPSMPLYPPVALSIAVGASPTHLIPVLTRIPVAVCEAPQTFVLPADAPVGCFVRLTLHGRVQMQLEDSQYYTAVRCVRVFWVCGVRMECVWNVCICVVYMVWGMVVFVYSIYPCMPCTALPPTQTPPTHSHRHVMVLGHPLSYTATREAAQGAHATHPHKGLPATALRSIHPPRYTRCSCYKATTAQRIRSTYEVYRNDHHDMDYVYDDHGVGAHEEEGEEEGEEDAHMHDAQSTTSTTNPCTTCTTTTAAHDGSGTGTRSNIQSTNTRTPPPAALLTASQSQPQMGQNKYQSQVQKQQKQVEPMRVHVLAGDGYVVTHRRVGEGGGDGGHAHPGHTSRGGMFGGLLAKLGMG